MSWSTEFEDPVTTPHGKPLPTLSDARAYILKLKKKDQDSPHRHPRPAEGRRLRAGVLAGIGMLKEMNHPALQVFADRKGVRT